MSGPPYMKWYPGDYARRTQHLTTIQHGAYRMLIDAMWAAGGRLPNDHRRLLAIAKMTPAEWAENAAVIMEFFTVDGGSICQDRVTKQLLEFCQLSEKRREAGKAGAEKKHSKNNIVSLASARKEAMANATITRTRARKEERELEPTEVGDIPNASEEAFQDILNSSDVATRRYEPGEFD